ncbi:hypothetical protein BGZ60DRAFT_436775 [Tricladium varicosporioides]|nr:hypothetical protein BGZ60DRAFT_436775 [Hymenoscyphus varicosporioides]
MEIPKKLSTPPPSGNSGTKFFVTSPGYLNPPFNLDFRCHYPYGRCEDALSLLSVRRLDSISQHLWMAGRPQSDPMKKSSLHRLKATGFELVVFEQADMHLLWQNGIIYIKPLPSFLMNFDFWQENLCSRDETWDARTADIVDGALGLVFSYTWLIRWESDLRIAHEHGLISKSIDYDHWMSFRSSFLSNFNRNQLPRAWLSWRYDFAELRLNRINLIWRLRPRRPFDISSLLRGYQTPYRIYSSFFEKNFGIVIVAFVYATVVLTAMQLGLATTQLNESPTFQRATVGFAVFSILLPVVILGLAIALFIILFFFNWWETKRHLRAVRPKSTAQTD